MATYFDGNNSNNNNNSSEINSSEGLKTLYLMNPNYAVPFSDSDSAQNPTHNNMLFLTPNNNNNTNTSTSGVSATTHPHALNLATLSHAPPQHFIGVTIPASNFVGPTNEISAFHGFSPATLAGPPRVHYNLWGSITDPTPNSLAAASVVTPAAAPPTATSISNSGHAAANPTTAAAAGIGFHRPGLQQGLSLSLSSQFSAYRSFSGEMDGVPPGSRRSDGNGTVMGSKFLRAAQELLDEVVNVGKGIFSIEGSSNKEKMKGSMNVESNSGVGGDGLTGGGGENSGANNNQGGELSTAQRQELQMKKSKLVSMLDEVEQRYRQYHHQMQVVISSFEEAAGYGAARSYTALALKTISKQFRCLKDAINSQIRATSKALGEDDCLGAKVEGSRLRYVDHHLRQQRALQQLGMIQHNAWRPQRGLPERAVSVLRAWLFEHFLHPYPKDSDKVMLAKQTGLTRSQVSNWFINARVRLWKPMVEEMYMEEVKDQDHNNNNNNGPHHQVEKSKESNNNNKELLWSTQEQQQEGAINNNTTSTDQISNNSIMSQSPIGGASSSLIHSPGSILSADMDMKPASVDTNRGEANDNNITNKFGNINEIRNHVGGYGSLISMEDIGRFNNTIAAADHQQLAPRFHGNGVSLTLGLPPSDNHNHNPNHNHNHNHQNHHLPSPLSGGFLSQNSMHNLGGGGTNENEFCALNNPPPPPPSSHSGNSYDHSIDMQNRKRFAAQLLRDFVS